MTKEDKKLLLMDLCARLPYGVFLKIGEYSDYTLQGIVHSNANKPLIVRCNGSDFECSIDVVKPYLRPMSSMTEEEFEKLKEYSELIYDQLDLTSFQNGAYKILDFYLNEVPSGAVIRVFDWLNKYHFDYRDLIQMGLAIAVTENNNPYKE